MFTLLFSCLTVPYPTAATPQTCSGQSGPKIYRPNFPCAPDSPVGKKSLSANRSKSLIVVRNFSLTHMHISLLSMRLVRRCTTWKKKYSVSKSYCYNKVRVVSIELPTLNIQMPAFRNKFRPKIRSK